MMLLLTFQVRLGKYERVDLDASLDSTDYDMEMTGLRSSTLSVTVSDASDDETDNPSVLGVIKSGIM